MSKSIYIKNHQQLEHLMQQVGIPTVKELSRLSEVSEWQITRIEYGLILKIPVEILLKLANTLEISLNDFLTRFSSDEAVSLPLPEQMRSDTYALESLEEDYQQLQQLIEQERETSRNEFHRLQQQMEQQKETLKQEFQRSSLQTLESWLLQWPTAALSAQKNPKLPAIKLLPLLKPMAILLKQWGVEAIASVGELVPYDPQYHQLMEGQAEPGERVRVRYVGYRQGDTLLYRAKVSSLEAVAAPKTESVKTVEDTEENKAPTTVLDIPQSSTPTNLDAPDDSSATILDVSEDAAVDEATAKKIIQ
ncbi:helix-turn-helix domain-containing protein [Gloeothece verrucosa]|uniref:Transcriptional regulator, XRE family n=1 Tax=Gloeothece verrucosa (strain PCC 7822) TaxID=497965 RepID=E0UCZ0_GLOV7|nr:helix-turn-helix transcriptional regulator [Gloeothece verrucosa]ADN16455.1 transcriptional regulator, XRE family [Gloeothece verrucosa PCC 7822]